MRSPLRHPVASPLAGLAAAGFVVLLAAALAAADNMPEMDEDAIHRATENWRGRIFLVVADAGPGHVPVKQVLENPRALYRQRRVGCALFLGSGRHLLTTASVTTGGSEVEIFDSEGRHVLARVVGTDRFLDLALLEAIEEIPGTEAFPPVDFAGEPVPGSPCLVLGNAYGHDLAAALGRLSGTIEISTGGVPARAHRIAARIYPGDSGALVLDAEGNFVGLVTGVSAPGRHPVLEHSGEIAPDADAPPAGETGFAVPGRECRRAWMDLRDFGHVRRGYLGVHIASVDESGHGARILNVTPGGPAAAAGLMQGDVVTTFGDLFVRGARQLCAYVASAEPMTPVKVRLEREGHERVVSLVVGVTSELPKMQHVPAEQVSRPSPATEHGAVLPVGEGRVRR